MAKPERKPATQDKSKPIFKAWVNGVTAAVWSYTEDKKTTYSVTLQRSYKDDKDQWCNSDFLFQSDLQGARKALDKAHDYILAQYEEKAA